MDLATLVCRHDVYFVLSMTDAMGNYVEHVYPKSHHLYEPMLTIMNEAGQRIHTDKMFWNTSYETFYCMYRLPLQYSGKFTARIKYDMGPIETTAKEAVFNVD